MSRRTRLIRNPRVRLQIKKSLSILARFEAELQALAMMDHPNVAKVLDANATDVGRPYFVMELVKGIPMTWFDAAAPNAKVTAG